MVFVKGDSWQFTSVTHAPVSKPMRLHSLPIPCNGVFPSTPPCGLFGAYHATLTLAIGSLTTQFTLVNSTLVFVQYLYSPNFLILVARILIQSQIVNSHVTHPGRSLFGLGAMLTFMNVMAAGLHSIDFMTGMNGGKGVILDFVGQCKFR
jgi:hypothetical protein